MQSNSFSILLRTFLHLTILIPANLKMNIYQMPIRTCLFRAYLGSVIILATNLFVGQTWLCSTIFIIFFTCIDWLHCYWFIRIACNSMGYQSNLLSIITLNVNVWHFIPPSKIVCNIFLIQLLYSNVSLFFGQYLHTLLGWHKYNTL